jgi:hypothetical protein
MACPIFWLVEVLNHFQFRSAQERRFEELELSCESLRQEKLTLISELQSAKEKLHSCEALVARLGKRSEESNQSDLMDHQLNSLTQQVRNNFTCLEKLIFFLCHVQYIPVVISVKV